MLVIPVTVKDTSTSAVTLILKIKDEKVCCSCSYTESALSGNKVIRVCFVCLQEFIFIYDVMHAVKVRDKPKIPE